MGRKTKAADMGHVFTFHDTQAYAQWVLRDRNHWSALLQTRLMVGLLAPVRGETVLDIGCGTGMDARPLLDLGVMVTGIDPSPYMLDIANEYMGKRVDFYRGHAEDLPFEDNAFNHAVFLFSLEFVDNPVRAMEEACRVAKDKVYVGFLNRFALKGIELRLKGLFNATIYNKARLFSVWELKRMARAITGPVPVVWRTACQLPHLQMKMIQSWERSDWVQHCPFGAFGAMAVTLAPRFRTRPIAILHRGKRHRLITGSSPARPLTLGGKHLTVKPR